LSFIALPLITCIDYHSCVIHTQMISYTMTRKMDIWNRGHHYPNWTNSLTTIFCRYLWIWSASLVGIENITILQSKLFLFWFNLQVMDWCLDLISCSWLLVRMNAWVVDVLGLCSLGTVRCRAKWRFFLFKQEQNDT